MSNYQFNTKIITAPLNSLLKDVESCKAHRVLILSSPTVVKNAAVEHFIKQLKETVNLHVFAGISPDAPIAPLDELIKGIEKPDLIIGIGGGSVVDSSKAISLGWQNATIYELFYKQKSMPVTKIPVFVAPTTAGTGAELSYGAILYDVAGKIKSGVRGALLQPEIALIDIELYKTAPSKLIAEVGFDCLTHAVETYISTASSPLVQYQSVAAINNVFAHLRDAAKKNEDALLRVAMAATMMGANLALSSTCLPHRIQYVIGPMTNTSHAQGLIMLYKGWIREVSATGKYKQLATDLHLTGDELENKIKQLKSDLGIDYKLSDYGIAEKDTSDIAERVEGNLTNDPCYSSTKTIVNILKNSL